MHDFLLSNLASFLWGLSAFAVFVLVIFKLGVKHILAAVDAREARLKKELDESQDAFQKAQTIKAELEAKMRGAEAKIGEMMAEARKDAEAHKGELVEKGRQEIEAIRVRALREIEAARAAAIITLRKEVAEVSVLVASQIINEKLDAAKHESLVALAIDAYEARQAKGA